MKAENFLPSLGPWTVLLLGIVACLGDPANIRAEMPTAPTDGATEGSTVLLFNIDPLTIQNLYLESELLGLEAGDIITGISFRLNGAVAAFAGVNFTRFDVVMGQGGDTLGTTFADNFAGTPLTARSGALNVGAADFEDGQIPNTFGKVLKFTTPFQYAGGNLIVEIRASTGDLALDMFNGADGIQGTAVLADSADATMAGAAAGTLNLAVAFEITRDGKPPTEVVIPTAATGEGSVAFDLSFSNSGRTVQNIVRKEELGDLKAGDLISGFCLRWDGTGVNPTFLPGVTFARFDVRLGRWSGSGSTLFANQFAEPPTAVRNGPMTVMFPVSIGDPLPFGALVRFTTPYVHKGGDLVVETRFSDPVTPNIGSVPVDELLLSPDGSEGEILFSDDPDATVAGIRTPINWALQFKTCPDAEKPEVRFRGRAKKKPGSRPTRVKGVASDNGAVQTILFRASTGDKKTLNVDTANAPFRFKFRNRKMKPRVRVRIIAIDCRGNLKVGKRVYR